VSSLLQREIRQRRPFQSPAQEAALGLLRTADLIRRQATALVEPHGITLQQFNVLRILRGSRDEGFNPAFDDGAAYDNLTSLFTNVLHAAKLSSWSR